MGSRHSLGKSSPGEAWLLSDGPGLLVASERLSLALRSWVRPSFGLVSLLPGLNSGPMRQGGPCCQPGHGSWWSGDW